MSSTTLYKEIQCNERKLKQDNTQPIPCELLAEIAKQFQPQILLRGYRLSTTQPQAAGGLGQLVPAGERENKESLSSALHYLVPVPAQSVGFSFFSVHPRDRVALLG